MLLRGPQAEASGHFPVKFISGSALPSPKRLAFAEALAQAGYAQAGLKLSQPVCLSLGYQ